MNAEGTLIWTVSIKDRLEPEMDIWTATFSTEKKADDFIEKAKEKLRSYDALNTTDVIKDIIDDDYSSEEDESSPLDDDYIPEEYRDEEW